MTGSTVTMDHGLSRTLILRRYMDLASLLDLLRSKSLYLRRADGFHDRLEGALFPALRNSLDDAHQRGQNDRNADYFYRRARTGSFVCCWSIGAKDNMALWQLYGGTKSSVAVTTTVERLIKVAISWPESALIHRVKYVDHLRVQNWIIGKYTDVLHYKNEAYRYEKELRLIIPRQGATWESNPMGIRLPLQNFSDLIRSVVVAPESEPWFLEGVRDLCNKYKLAAPVRQSKLAVVPK